MYSLRTNTSKHLLGRKQQLREAVLLTFCDPWPEECARLKNVSAKEWMCLLEWLDISGLALYFLDCLRERNRCDLLPPKVHARLLKNLADNTERIDELIAEWLGIERKFTEAGLVHATLKGFSLWPLSIPKLALRSQLDLDFLIAEEAAEEARRILEERGYRLCAISGRTWEFKADEDRIGSMGDFYKSGMIRSAELHLEPIGVGIGSLLSRAQQTTFYGVDMTVLSPVDLFLGQGIHLYKHVCGEFARVAHMIEFRRHVIARHGDKNFWCSVREQAVKEPQTSLRLGVVILLISRVMGNFAPEALTHWTVGQVPAGVVRWVELYGRRTVLASFPGSKLYLLLQKELEAAGVVGKRSVRQSLIPRRLPPLIAHGAAGETVAARLTRYRRQISFVLFRFRFHVVEGIRFFREAFRWRQHVNEVIQ
jgi:Uncharacterised nucleotidyltransferase